MKWFCLTVFRVSNEKRTNNVPTRAFVIICLNSIFVFQNMTFTCVMS